MLADASAMPDHTSGMHPEWMHPSISQGCSPLEFQHTAAAVRLGVSQSQYVDGILEIVQNTGDSSLVGLSNTLPRRPARMTVHACRDDHKARLLKTRASFRREVFQAWRACRASHQSRRCTPTGSAHSLCLYTGQARSRCTLSVPINPNPSQTWASSSLGFTPMLL